VNPERSRTEDAGTLRDIDTPGGSAQPRTKPHVMVVDDEPMVREVIISYLERDGYRVTGVADGATALRTVEAARPDLIVLDLMLPQVDGLAVLAQVRKSTDVPVIVLTARGEEPDRVLGLELGADDYVVKPFSPRELAARVSSVLRRARPSPVRGRIVHDSLVIDNASREVTVRGSPVALTAREFDLLAFLAAAPRQVFSRAELLEQVWDSSAAYQDPSTVTVHIRRLRNKIEVQPDQPCHLLNVWGVGYRFDP
jgi:DNA-binding response OmpR family regulator